AYVANFMGQANYIDVQVVDKYGYQSCFGLLGSNRVIENAVGEKLRLLLRPEHISITPDINGSAVVKQVDFQGALQQITVQFSEQEFIVRYSNHSSECLQFAVGDNVSLQVLSHDFVTFEQS
ncbi:TOBE domain-containing protein, partial [Psychromonas sp.]|nr:TOBE domain-containing protein [Psychromonas sp.]